MCVACVKRGLLTYGHLTSMRKHIPVNGPLHNVLERLPAKKHNLCCVLSLRCTYQADNSNVQIAILVCDADICFE